MRVPGGGDELHACLTGGTRFDVEGEAALEELGPGDVASAGARGALGLVGGLAVSVRHLGRAGEAQMGTLFFNELGEVPHEVQAWLLRLLDAEGEYIRMGYRASNARTCASSPRPTAAWAS